MAKSESMDRADELAPKNTKSRRTRIRADLLISYGLAALLLIALGLSTNSGFNLHRYLVILAQNAQFGVAAIGQSFALLSGGLDLSIGPVINLTNIVASTLMNGQNSNILVALIVSLLIAASIGAINGLLVTKAHIPPLLATLAVGTVIQGAYYVYTGGQPSGNSAPGFALVANGWIKNVLPINLIIWLAVWGLSSYFLYQTTFGRRFYATGANSRAAWLSGISYGKYTVTAYIASSLCAAVAGLQLTSYIGVASIGVGDSYTLNTIAAAIIGGIAFSGGIGKLAGTFAGVLVMISLTTILSTLNVPQASQYIVQGIVIVLMMLLNKRLSGK